MKQYAVLAFSGGMDSSSLLLHLLAKGFHVTALSFLYGQKHAVEIEYAKSLMTYLQSKGYVANHQIISLNDIASMLYSALVQDDLMMPQGQYTKENMHDTVVPNRNKIFISILQAVALSIAEKNQTQTYVAMGIHAGDHRVYPDCRPGFIEQDYQAFLQGNWHAEKVVNYLPYLDLDKYGILADGAASCTQLALDFDDVYRRTLTSYQPNSQGVADYKTPSSVQRIAAFIKLGRPDPASYADETGLVDWLVAKKYVEQLL